jgi:uncharacterized protein (DUF433 family)
VSVDRGGNIIVLSEPDPEVGNRQRAIAGGDLLNVIEPFPAASGSRGPDLYAPRPTLRIVPGKLGGSPHVAHTRLESQALGALAAGGLPLAKIHRLYPDVASEAIEDALDLERQLARNLHVQVAA